jgi:hypothetical protein
VVFHDITIAAMPAFLAFGSSDHASMIDRRSASKEM